MTRRLAPKDFVGKGLAKRACTTPEEPSLNIISNCFGKEQVREPYREAEPPCPRSRASWSPGPLSVPCRRRRPSCPGRSCRSVSEHLPIDRQNSWSRTLRHPCHRRPRSSPNSGSGVWCVCCAGSLNGAPCFTATLVSPIAHLRALIATSNRDTRGGSWRGGRT